MRRQSLKRQREQRIRRQVLARLLDERGPGCEALIPSVCTGMAQDGHERLSRARGGSIVDPANIVLVCRPCHRFVTVNPAQAVALGLSRHSWDGAA